MSTVEVETRAEACSPASTGAAENGCPFHVDSHTAHSTAHSTAHIVAKPAGVREDDVLVIAHPKRMVAQYLADDAGTTSLHLFYGDKEITFDEPATYAFGEHLAIEAQFRARDAAAWGGQLSWPRTKALLDDLLEAGVLTLANVGVNSL